MTDRAPGDIAPVPSTESPSKVYDGTPFESTAAYARAVRRGSLIAVSGTVAMGVDGTVAFPGDVRLQTREALRKAVAAVESLGGTLEDVVRTRIYLVPGSSWQGTASAHAEVFAGVNPANTSLFVAGLFVPGALVEVEIEAFVEGPREPAASHETQAQQPASIDDNQSTNGPSN